jgi:hypothetical protein
MVVTTLEELEQAGDGIVHGRRTVLVRRIRWLWFQRRRPKPGPVNGLTDRQIWRLVTDAKRTCKRVTQAMAFLPAVEDCWWRCDSVQYE